MHRNCTLKINENDRVLEIGAGGQPHPKSSLIVDKFLGEEGLRQRGRAAQIIDRPFLHADGCKLPFPDKSFNYVIASHVIEHIPKEDIEKFVSELNRVASAGYIEAPSVLFECLLDISEHIWIVSCKNGKVHLYKKLSEDISPLKKFILPMFKIDQAFWKWNISRYDDLWLTGMEWKESLEYIIHTNLSEIINLYNDQEIIIYLKGIANQTEIQTVRSMLGKRIVSIFKRILKVQLTVKRKIQNVFKNGSDLYVFERGLNWRDIVVCPYCKNELTEIKGFLECRTCDKKYPILKGDIPSFVDVVGSEC